MAESDPGRARTAALAAAMLGALLLIVSFVPSTRPWAPYFLPLIVAVQIVAATVIARSLAQPASLPTETEVDPRIPELEAAVVAAEQALETKIQETERFTYIVSHDLRSPLLTIQGFADILVMDVEDGKAEAVEEDLDHILKATGRLRLLLDDLLELSRIGRFAEPASRVPLAVVIDDAKGELEELIEEKQARIEIESDLPEVVVDRGRVQQLFRILLDNAVRYGAEGRPPHVQVGRNRTEAGSSAVELFVSDDGVGMEPDNLKKAFGPFERFSADSVGSGMGLALAQRIVDYHQGSIRAESAGKGHGTTIIFSLGEPLEETESETATS